MAVYTFPLPLDQFFDGLPIQSVNFDLPEMLASSQTGGGEILTADLGDRLWRADVVLAPQYYYEMETIKAKLHMLRYAARTLIVHQMPIIAPSYDRDGVILGASTVTLTNVAGNNREITLSGLPADYVLTTGDGFSFQYGANPVRYAFHQIVQGGTASSGGVATVEVVPFIQPGATLPLAVQLIKPIFKAVIIPGSFDPGESRGKFTTGAKFSVMQTLR